MLFRSVPRFVDVPGGFEAGSGRRLLTVPGLPPVAAIVCYEAIFSGEVVPRGASQRPGLLLNLTIALHLLSFWRVLKWESDSEWESSAQEWRIDSIKLVWALCSAYFVTAACACAVGVVGVVKVWSISFILCIYHMD